MPTIQENIFHLTSTIRFLEKKYQRPPHSVMLLAISKNQSLEKIQEAIAAGQCHFGENYCQEALLKINTLKNAEIEWHFTGNIQSNKTRHIAESFAWVHTINNKKIAQRLNDQRPAHLLPLQVCLEVNVSQESSKSGVIGADELLALAEYCISMPRLQLRGLMAMPAPKKTFSEQRAECHALYVLTQQLCDQELKLDTLSMGMTDDMEAAIAEGATIVRIGRGVFFNTPIIP